MWTRLKSESESANTWTSRIENFLVVTLIALLVWLFAEGRAVTSLERMPVSIQFVAPEGRNLAIEPVGEISIELDLKGSSGQIDWFNTTARTGPIRISIDEYTPTPVNLLNALNQSILGDRGLNITRIEPMTQPVSVEQIETIRRPIQVVSPDALLGPNVLIEPAEATIRLPERLVRDAADLSVIASLDAVNLSNVTPNEPTTVEVRLRLPDRLASVWSSVEPRTAQVTFTVRRLTETFVLQSVPVRISVPPSIMEGYRFELDDTNRLIDRVELSGPSDMIAEIRERRREVFAEIRPRVDDLRDGVVRFPVHLQTPPGVTVESAQPTVEVRITPLTPND